MLFKKTKTQPTPSSEAKLNTIVDLIKDLPRPDSNRLREGMDLIYNGYQKIKNAKTNNEKELGDIDVMERIIEEVKNDQR